MPEYPLIYRQLVRELGDVLAETRRAAEQAHTQAKQSLDFSSVRQAHKDRESRAFSAFG